MKLSAFYGIPNQDGNAFSFTQERIHRAIAFGSREQLLMGSALSSFQAHPLLAIEGGTCDWQVEIIKNINNQPNHILYPQDRNTFPCFMDKPDLYFKRSEELHQNSFRISLEMYQLCPHEYSFNEAIMASYVRAIAMIKLRGQEPIVTLYHWPLPSYAEGWEYGSTVRQFKFYVECVVTFLANTDKVSAALKPLGLKKEIEERLITGGLVKYFLTINEPSSILPPGYIVGVFPPFKKWRFGALPKVTKNLVEAHDIAYHTLKEWLPTETKVGIAHAWHYCDGPLATLMQKSLPYLGNEDLMQRFERDGTYTDFIGFQYYYRYRLLRSFGASSDKLFGDHPHFGDIYPPGMYDNLMLLNRLYPQKEILISEFGFAEKDDRRRPYLILETVRYVLEAMSDGVPIIGMLIWTLVSNFEWALGMTVPFGLFKESDLDKPLAVPTDGSIASWEVWQSVVLAMRNPTTDNLSNLQANYYRAKTQFRRSFL